MNAEEIKNLVQQEVKAQIKKEKAAFYAFMEDEFLTLGIGGTVSQKRLLEAAKRWRDNDAQ